MDQSKIDQMNMKEILNSSEAAPDYTDYYITSALRLGTSDTAKKLLSKYGIGLKAAKRFAVGFDPEWSNQTDGEYEHHLAGHPCLIIPINASSYAVYDTQTTMQIKVGSLGLLNIESLDSAHKSPVFIVETEMDVLSLAEIGEEAISLGRKENTEILLDKIEKTGPGTAFVVSLKHNDSCPEVLCRITKEFGASNVSYIVNDVAGKYKDINKALLDDREALEKAVAEAKHKVNSNPDGIGNYILCKMDEEISAFKENLNLKTGFENLDKYAGSIYPGLYVIGAISSLGKTTFAHQIADKMASEKHHVLFFSFEQSRMELVSKSLARISAQRNLHTTITSLDVRMNGDMKEIFDLRNDYINMVGNYLTVVEGDFLCTASKIRETVQNYIVRTGVKPVVIVDYLQIIPGNIGDKGSKKDSIDENLTKLKWLSRSEAVPVILVSSINRSNYLTTIDFESFKESGGIEYTADVLWGLQLDIINDQSFNLEKELKKKRDKIREAKAAEPQEIELVCLKNRYGISSYSAHFHYYAAHDLFIPIEEKREEPINCHKKGVKQIQRRF